MNILYIYAKNELFKVYGEKELMQNEHDELIRDGWIHTNTLNSAIWLRYLLTKTDKGIVKSVRGLLFPNNTTINNS